MAPPKNGARIQKRAGRFSKLVFCFFRNLNPAVALKQGAGRLIRRETDQGVLVVCDTRLATMGYGKRLLRALPPMPRLVSEVELLAKLDAISRP